MLVVLDDRYMTGDRCALCGRVLRQSLGGDGLVTYCAGCGIDFPPTIEGYDRNQDYITPDGHFEFVYEERGLWRRWDMWEAETQQIRELELPGKLVLKRDWIEQQAQCERVRMLFGDVEQLLLIPAVKGY